VTEVHWRTIIIIIIIIVYYAKWQHRKNTIIYTKYKNTNIANLGLNSDPNLPRIADALHAGAMEGIIAGKSGEIISRYASHG